MKQAGILPKLKLGERREGDNGKESVFPTGAHKVKLIEDKIKKGKDNDGKIIDVVHYIVEEDGVKKFYEVPVKDKTGNLHYLNQKLSEIPEGCEVILEMKKRGIKNYISVSLVGEPMEVEDEDGHMEPNDEEEDIQDSSPFPKKINVANNTGVDYPEEDAEPNFDVK
jgi:hypothetical protein